MASHNIQLNPGDTLQVKAGFCPPGSTTPTPQNRSLQMAPGDTLTAAVAACATTPPNPPPSGDDAIGGYKFTSGFWNNWRVRAQDKFIERDGGGAMKQNTQGVRYVAVPGAKGRYQFRAFFSRANQLNLAGGRHLGGMASYSLAFSPDHDAVEANSVRIDLDRPSDGKIRVHPYIFKDGALSEPVFWANVQDMGLNKWCTVELKWERLSPTQLKITLNGTSQTIAVHANAPNPSRYIAVGNLDGIEDAVGFKDFLWGN